MYLCEVLDDCLVCDFFYAQVFGIEGRDLHFHFILKKKMINSKK